MDSPKQRKAHYRLLFKTITGRKVLDDILAFVCLYHGRIGINPEMTDEEVYTRQCIGREILQIMGIIPGKEGRCKPDGFVAKLLTEPDDTLSRRKKDGRR